MALFGVWPGCGLVSRDDISTLQARHLAHAANGTGYNGPREPHATLHTSLRRGVLVRRACPGRANDLICLGRVLGGLVRIRCPGMKPPIGVGQAHREMLSFVRVRQTRAFYGWKPA